MKKEDAEKFTQSLGQIVSGSVGQMLWAHKQGVHKALGLKFQDSRLYRETHKTFESYCQERWDWTKNSSVRRGQFAGAGSCWKRLNRKTLAT